MKKIIILLISILLCTNLFSQKSKKVSEDTSEICIPYSVGQKILLDLNNYDKLKEVVVTYKSEIYELENKSLFLNKEIVAWKKEDELNQEIITEKNETIKIYKSENEDLKKENKRLKTRNGLFNIISGLIITPLTYYAIFK
jgi:hypothetical protein